MDVTLLESFSNCSEPKTELTDSKDSLESFGGCLELKTELAVLKEPFESFDSCLELKTELTDSREPFESFGSSGELKIELTDSKDDILNCLEEKYYKCNDCSFVTDRASSFQRHLLIHEDEDKKSDKRNKRGRAYASQAKKKPFECDKCEAVFAALGALKSHKLTHTQKRPYKCNECGAGFNQRGTLMTHLLVHTGEKPYQCSECDKAFNQARHLKTHMFSHTGIKPFVCSQCGKTFTRADNMKTHLVCAHSGKKPYKCFSSYFFHGVAEKSGLPGYRVLSLRDCTVSLPY